MDLVKQKFIQNILRDEGRRFIRNQGNAMRVELQFHTGETFNRRSFAVSGTTLSISMPIHVRFLDIRKDTTRRRPGSGFRVSKKGYRIYNRFKEGHKIGLANRLATEFTDEIVADIRRTFNIK